MNGVNEKVISNFEDSSLYKFLGATEAEDFKRQVKEIFLDRIREDIAQYDYYLISEGDIAGLVQSISEELKAEVMAEYGATIKQKMKDIITKSIFGGEPNV